MVFCTYCGKSFTRKEHLERHIPRHTNVMPYRCTLCQLSFPRRDLAQRHHFAYHETKDPMQSLPCGVVPPIACTHCASAKTRCDKRVPCSRCVEKELVCEARFARRRSGKPRSSSTNVIPTPHPDNHLINPGHMTPQEPHIDGSNLQHGPTMSPQHPEPPRQKPAYPLPPLAPAADNFGASGGSVRGMDNPIFLDSNLLDGDYQDLMMWNQYSSELFPNAEVEAQTDAGHSGSLELTESSLSSEAQTLGSTLTSLSSWHTRTASVASQPPDFEQFHIADVSMSNVDGVMPESEVAIITDAAWPLARCNPPTFSGSCPRTAIIYLETLGELSKHETWKLLDHNIASPEVNYEGEISVVPLTASTRDRILAITQSFLHRALDTHRGGQKGWDKMNSPEGGFNFLILPPSRVLEYFLRSSGRNLALYYMLVDGGLLDPNSLMPNSQAYTLLLLLMIAHGATAIPMARSLTAGLTEACRISLFHLIEKDVELSADPLVLRCALLFIILGAWSGDAWHMNIAMGQRGMYLAMLKHAGMMEPVPSPPPMGTPHDPSSTEHHWRIWQQRESKSRLVYNWAIVDQELSLFHDTAPILSITDLGAPMPGSECLWSAKDAVEWLTAIQTDSGTIWMSPNSLPSPPLPPSLCELFQDMLHDNMRYGQLSPLQLRLLLHPIQSLLFHLRQICFSDLFGSRRGSRTITKTSTLLRLEEIQSLLQKWYELSAIYAKSNPSCLTTQANLILYHLISLNAITSFPEIERLARREGLDGSGREREISLRYKRCIHEPEEAVFHCGQVIRLACSIPKEGQPYWWSTALYRAHLILWVESMFRVDQKAQGMEHQDGRIFAINVVRGDDPLMTSFLCSGVGVPMLLRGDTQYNLLPDEVLSHCIVLLEQGRALRVSEGIRRKLQALSANWSMKGI